MTPEETGRLMREALTWALDHAPAGASPAVLREVLQRELSRYPGEHAQVIEWVMAEDWPTCLRVIEWLRAPPQLDAFPVAVGQHVWSRKAEMWVPKRELDRVVTMDWPGLVRGMTTPRRVRGGKLRAPWWLPAVVEPDAEGRLLRLDAQVTALWALVADLDDGDPVYRCIEAVRAMGRRALVHTTWSHSPDIHKARVIWPFDSLCPVDRWVDVWAAGSRWVASMGLTIDPKCKNPARLYFLPALPDEEWAQRRSWFVAEAIGGPALDWQRLAAEHAPPPEERRGERPERPSLGKGRDALDREQHRRQRFAEGVVEHRARGVVAQGKGGRNQTLYTAGRAVAQLAAAGVLDEDWGRARLVSAGMDAGLTQREAETATDNGIRKGRGDEPWQF